MKGFQKILHKRLSMLLQECNKEEISQSHKGTAVGNYRYFEVAFTSKYSRFYPVESVHAIAAQQGRLRAHFPPILPKISFLIGRNSMRKC